MVQLCIVGEETHGDEDDCCLAPIFQIFGFDSIACQ